MTDTADTAQGEVGSDAQGAEKRGFGIASRRPDWWHRDHPVFGPLSGFYTGMLFIIIVPGTYAAVLKALFGYQRSESLFPFVALALAIPLGLMVPRRTRAFGRYMLFGCVATAIVVIGVAALTFYLLIKKDS